MSESTPPSLTAAPPAGLPKPTARRGRFVFAATTTAAANAAATTATPPIPDYALELNGPQQRAVLASLDVPLLVLAGAGYVILSV